MSHISITSLPPVQIRLQQSSLAVRREGSTGRVFMQAGGSSTLRVANNQARVLVARGGIPGIQGAIGAPGAPGADSTVPGPVGPDGPAGAGISDGDKGDMVVSGAGAAWAFDPTVVTAFGRTLVDDVDAATARSTLGLGTASTTAASAYEVAGAVTAHLAAGDPHPQYLTPAEGNAAYSALGHTHAQADVTGLVAALAGKAATAHTHAQADVMGLVAALAGKAATVHAHMAADTSDFSEAVDDRVAAFLVAGANITLTYNDAGNILTIAATAAGGSGLTHKQTMRRARAYK